MTSLDVSLPGSARRDLRRKADGDWLRTGAAWIAVTAMLVLIGRAVAVSLDSPLLAIVADGMLFLAGVAVRGAIGQQRR